MQGQKKGFVDSAPFTVRSGEFSLWATLMRFTKLCLWYPALIYICDYLNPTRSLMDRVMVFGGDVVGHETANLKQNLWYSGSRSCVASSHCRASVPEYIRACENLTVRESYWRSIGGDVYLASAHSRYSADERQKLENTLIMLPWPLRSGTGRTPADTAPTRNRSVSLFLQIMRFTVYRN